MHRKSLEIVLKISKYVLNYSTKHNKNFSFAGKKFAKHWSEPT